MAKTYINIKTRVDAQKDRINDITNLIGDMDLLSTTQDSDLVTAINELDSDIGENPASNLTTTEKTLTGAINEHDAEIGSVDSLTTDATNISAAINELDEYVDDNLEAIAVLDSDIGNRALLSSNISNTASLVNAINSIQTGIGAAAFSGLSASTIKGAINETISELGDVTSLTTDASVVVEAINELDSDIGDISNLSPAEINNRDNIVEALNEVASTANLALDSAGAAGAKIGLLAELLTTDKSDIVSSINEIVSGFIDSARGAINGSSTITYTSATGVISVSSNAINSTQLNVSGTGDALQALVSDGDGSFSWGLKIPSIYDSDGTLLNG